MKTLFVYCIEWDNWYNLDFGASLPRCMYLILTQKMYLYRENLTKENISEEISKAWFGIHKPISFRFREAADEELNTNCYRNCWPIIKSKNN